MLKQVIQYTNANAIEATWVQVIDGKEVVTKCQSYANNQMDLLAADLGADAAAYQSLMDRVAATYKPIVEPEQVPHRVSMRQARLALLEAGMYSNVNAAIANIEDERTRQAAEIEWEYATDVERNAGLVPVLGAALGLSEADLDNLFRRAATL